jgi:hypothetical protein
MVKLSTSMRSMSTRSMRWKDEAVRWHYLEQQKGKVKIKKGMVRSERSLCANKIILISSSSRHNSRSFISTFDKAPFHAIQPQLPYYSLARDATLCSLRNVALKSTHRVFRIHSHIRQQLTQVKISASSHLTACSNEVSALRPTMARWQAERQRRKRKKKIIKKKCKDFSKNNPERSHN